MKRFTSAALVLGTLMAIAPAGAFAHEFDYRRDGREHMILRQPDLGRRFERVPEWREHVRLHLDRCR